MKHRRPVALIALSALTIVTVVTAGGLLFAFGSEDNSAPANTEPSMRSQADPSPAGARPQPPSDNQAKDKARMGVQVTTITPSVKARLALLRDSGIVITEVFDDSPGAIAGLLKGDVILRVGNTDIGVDVLVLQRTLSYVNAGQTMEVQIARGQEVRTLLITLPASSLSMPNLDALPPAIREQLQSQLNQGKISHEQLYEAIHLYQQHSQNVVVGNVTEVSTTITLSPASDLDNVTMQLTDATTIKRAEPANRNLSASDIPINAQVLLLSMDGGQTAFSVTIFVTESPER